VATIEDATMSTLAVPHAVVAIGTVSVSTVSVSQKNFNFIFFLSQFRPDEPAGLTVDVQHSGGSKTVVENHLQGPML